MQLQEKVKKIKSKYKIGSITIKDRDGEASVTVKHKDKDNKKEPIKIKLMSVAEMMKLASVGAADLEAQIKAKEDTADKTMLLSDAEAIALAVAEKHYVFEDVSVAVKGDRFEYTLDLAGQKMPVAGSGVKAEKVETPTGSEAEGAGANPSIIGLSAPIKADGGHTVKIEGTVEKFAINVYSAPKSLNALINDKRQEVHDNQYLDPDYKLKQEAINSLVQLKETLGSQVGRYRRAVDNAYKGGTKTEIITAHSEVKITLRGIGSKLDIVGIDEKEWELPKTKVLNAMEGGKAKRVIAQPLTRIPGNTAGSAATSDPKGWESIDINLRTRGDWVRAHLLSHKLQGPGDKVWNLFPGTKEMNLQNMENQIESIAKGLIDKRAVLYYNVVLTYGNKGQYDFIPREVYMEFGRFEHFTSSRTEIIKNVTFTQEPPSGIAIAANSINSSSANSLSEIAKNGGFNGMHGFFVNLVKERKNTVFTENIILIKNKLSKYYTEDSKVLDLHIANLEVLFDESLLVV